MDEDPPEKRRRMETPIPSLFDPAGAYAGGYKLASSLIWNTTCNMSRKVMSEDASHLRAESLHLSRTLDEVGLNELTVKRRRKAILLREKIRCIFYKLRGHDYPVYHFGSQTEGTTTSGLKADVDDLGCYNDVRIIQNYAEFEPGKPHLLMLQEDTAPGYCRLQLLYPNIPIGSQDLPNEDFTYDSNGRVIVKNTLINRSFLPDWYRNGPARTQSGVPGVRDTDSVTAFKYDSWPGQAEEFIRRQRHHGWPSQNLLQEAVKHGVFLVPVGHKLSPTEELEWRISASLSERSLMFSLSMVHIKCYVVLKMIMKTFVEPLVIKCISSYHCKTALLYCTENTDPGFWRDDNLLKCIIYCLTMLLTWVSEGFCPQFMISEENLFAGKVTNLNRGILMSILTDLIESNCCDLLRVNIDDLGKRLRAKLTTEPSVMPILDSFESMKVTADLEYGKQRVIYLYTALWFVEQNNVHPIYMISIIYHGIEMLKMLIDPSDRLEQQAITMWTQFLSCWLGSLLASVALSRKIRVPRLALRLLCIGAHSDCAATLKFASVLYCSGDVQIAETMLKKLEKRFCINEMIVVCACYNGPHCYSGAFCHKMHVLKGKTRRAKHFAPCVSFSSQEIHSAPTALHNELFRSFGNDMQHRDPIYDTWMDLAIVDCEPYLYYLQYMTYKQLGRRNLQSRARHNLDRCIKEDKDFHHLETAWNLLGQCIELEQQPEDAMACYRKSLGIRPRNNAANWHVAILCFKLIRNRTVIFNTAAERR